MENDFDDHKIGDEEVREIGKGDADMKEDEMESEDRVMPAALIVPLEEREPAVDLDKLAVINSPDEEVSLILGGSLPRQFSSSVGGDQSMRLVTTRR